MEQFEIFHYHQGQLERFQRPLPEEAIVTLRVNGQDWVSLYCTPRDLRELALGFLYSEGLIKGLEDVVLVRECQDLRVIEAVLYQDVPLPSRKIITSGCGQGVTYTAELGNFHLEGGVCLTPEKIFALMSELYLPFPLLPRIRRNPFLGHKRWGKGSLGGGGHRPAQYSGQNQRALPP
jgi:FdhD protein